VYPQYNEVSFDPGTCGEKNMLSTIARMFLLTAVEKQHKRTSNGATSGVLKALND